MSMDEPSTSGLFCDACSAHIPNETTFQQHLNGRKHIRNVERIKEWKDTAKRSVYVGGLKNVVAVELAIADFFGQFGNVKNITIDKTNKQYAIVEMDCERSVEKLLALENPVIGGNPVTIKPRELKENKPLSSRKEKMSQKQSAIDEKLWQKLLDVQDIGDQLSLLHEEEKLSEEEAHIRELICQLLQSALHEAFPNCTLKPYGSSVNGFGMHGCDLDLHFEYDEIHPDILHEIKAHRNDNAEENSTETTNKTATPQEIVAAVGEVIKQCVPDCHKIKVIAQTRFPLVRFYHMGSHVRCDLSLSNQLALVNTAYLRLCCEAFPLLKPLVVTIRTWMKHWELAGGVHVNGPRLNNYAVTLLVLFYLQKAKMLPSLEEMISAVPASERVIVDGWDCTLVEPHRLPKAGDFFLPDLLSDFFHFYAKVKFAEVVLDTRTASYRCVASACNPHQVAATGDQAARKFRYGALNICDPFELTHNVAGNVTERHMQAFYRHMHNAVVVVKMKRYFFKMIHGSSWGVLELFVDHHRKRDEQAAADSVKAGAYSFDVTIGVWDNTDRLKKAAGYFVTILRDVFAMDCIVVGEPDRGDSDERQTAQVTSVAVETFPSQANSAASGDHQPSGARKRQADDGACAFCKRAKVALDSPDVAAAAVPLSCRLQCAARHRLWQGRRKARRRLVQRDRVDLLDLERKVSQLLLGDLERPDARTREAEQQLDASTSSIDSNAPPLFRFEVEVGSVGEAGTLRFQFRCTSDDGHGDYVNFLHHLELFLPNLLKKCVATTPTSDQ